MELWSKGLGNRVLSLRLGERQALVKKNRDLVIEGVMHAPVYWDYTVSLGEVVTITANDELSSSTELAVKVNGQTGVEMEALTAVSVAALTIYDMCKAVDKTMTMNNVRLIEKSGGRSGHFFNSGETIK